jgi:hypothetical protein
MMIVQVVQNFSLLSQLKMKVEVASQYHPPSNEALDNNSTQQQLATTDQDLNFTNELASARCALSHH